MLKSFIHKKLSSPFLFWKSSNINLDSERLGYEFKNRKMNSLRKIVKIIFINIKLQSSKEKEFKNMDYAVHFYFYKFLCKDDFYFYWWNWQKMRWGKIDIVFIFKYFIDEAIWSCKVNCVVWLSIRLGKI